MNYEAAEKDSVFFKTMAVTGPADPRPFLISILRKTENVGPEFSKIFGSKTGPRRPAEIEISLDDGTRRLNGSDRVRLFRREDVLSER